MPVITRVVQARRKAGEESGVALVLTILVMLGLLVFAGYAIDTAIWFVHHRHLQTEADAAALAAGQNFQFGCGAAGDQTIQSVVHQYDGTGLSPTISPTYNQQVSVTPTPSSTLPSAGHILYSGLNQANYSPGSPYQTVPNDTGLTGSPCTDNVIDVKMTEQGLTSFFPFVSPAYVNAQARVGFQQAASTSGGIPFVEPLPTPTSVAVEFVNESNGNVLSTPGVVNLAKPSGDTSGVTWTAQTPITFADPTNNSTSDTFPLGMRVAVNPTGGAATFPCTAPESCFDNSTTPNLGITFTRVWSNSGSPGTPMANPLAPQLSDAWLQPCTASGGGCTACPSAPSPSLSNFFASTTNTTEQLCANMTFTSSGGTTITCADAGLTTKAGGTSVTMNCPNGSTGSPNGTWSSGPLTVPAFSPPNTNNGAMSITMGWSLTTGCLPVGASGGKAQTGTPTCTPLGATHTVCAQGNNGICTGSFDGNAATSPETVQQAYSGAYSLTSGLSTADGGTGPSNSGTISAARLTDLSGNEIQSIQNGTSTTAAITINFYGFQATTSISNPPFELTLGGNQGNGDISCSGNNGKTGFDQAIISGCAGTFAVNTLQPWNGPNTCPSGSTTATPGPATCLSTNPGTGKSSSIADALNTKINGNKNAACTSPNRWVSPNTVGAILDQNPADPRLVEVFYTDNITLPGGGSGGNGINVPIRGFAEFYITGWGNSKNNTADPCLTVANGGNWNPATPPPCPGTLQCTPDDLPPDNADGVVMGHFVTYVNSLGNGNGQTCTSGTLNICVPVLTK